MVSVPTDRISLWLDCDPGEPGHDDAFAILLAASHPNLELLGVSTVHGNASLRRTTANALSVLTAIGRSDIPVYPGAVKPFCRDAVHAPDIHGTSGIDGTNLLPTPTAQAKTDHGAIVAMHDALSAQPAGRAWLVATAALTNVALLFATFPYLAGHIKGLSIMGGAIGEGFTNAPLGYVKGDGERIGNISRWAEFNIYCDPESAQAIFTNPLLAIKTTLIPLDLTHQVLATEDILLKLLQGSPSSELARTTSSPLRPMFYELLIFFAHTYATVFGLTAGPPLHDPLAVAIILFSHYLEPELSFDDGGGERWMIEVVTDGLHSEEEGERGQVGRTIAKKAKDTEVGVRIPRSVNVRYFWEVIEKCMARAEVRASQQLDIN